MISTIVLYTALCGTLRQCPSIPNDQNDAITFVGGYSSYYASLTINGKPYVAYPVQPTTEYVDQLFVAADGSVVYLTASFSTTVTVSGRTRVTHWTLDSGAIKGSP